MQKGANMITEFVVATISYVKSNLQAESIAGIVFLFSLAMVFLLAVILLLLIFRKTRLWYWKTDEQLKVLQGIDSTLAEIKQGMANVHSSIDSLKDENISDSSPEELDKVEDDKENDDKDNNIEETLVETEVSIESEVDNCQETKTDVAVCTSNDEIKHKREPNVGKSGIVYEDDVLRQQIRY